MKLNPILVKKSLASLSAAISNLSHAIMPNAQDIAEYNAYLKSLENAKTIASGNTGKPDAPVKAEKAGKPVPVKKEERPAVPPETRIRIKPAVEKKKKAKPQESFSRQSSLPDKPMKLARMNEFLAKWEEETKVRKINECQGFAHGMGCAYEGVEHAIKGIYSNGVLLLNRRGTQYHRLVPVEQIHKLYPKNSGYSGEIAQSDKVEVGFGLPESEHATSFRGAVVEAVNGNSVSVKYSDTGAISLVPRACVKRIKRHETRV